MKRRRHVAPGVLLDPKLSSGKAVGLEGFNVDGVVGIDDDEHYPDPVYELLVHPGDLREFFFVLEGFPCDVAGIRISGTAASIAF